MDFSKELLNPKDTFHSFKELMSTPKFHFARRAIVETRDYEAGLVFVNKLINHLETFKPRLTRREYESFDYLLIFFKLTLFDKSDQWEQYINYYNLLRADPKRSHYFRGDSNRFNLIRKKINMERDGKKMGHMKHKPQTELSDIEIKRRFLRVLNEAEYSEMINNHFQNEGKTK